MPSDETPLPEDMSQTEDSQSATTDEPGAPPRSNRRVVLQAAGVVAVAFILSRLLGLARDIIMSAYFGVGTAEATAYALSIRLPDLIFNIIAGGALGSAFIPTFSGFFARQDEAGAWRLFSAVLNLIIVVVTLVAAVTAIFAPFLVNTFFISSQDAAAFPELPHMTISMMRWMLLSTVIFGASGVLMATLNARQHFLIPALAAAVYNIGIIIGIFLFYPDVMGIAYGTIIGALGHLLIQVPVLRSKGVRYQPSFSLRVPGVMQVLRLMAPRVLGLSFSYFNPVVVAVLARPLPVGSLVALDRAFLIARMPFSILGQAMGVAAFPTLSTLAAEGNYAELRRILATSLRSILFLGLPATAGLMVLRLPLVELLFERGQFTPQDTIWVSWALFFYALSLVALASLEVVARTFYALSDTVTPVVAGILQLPMMALLGGFFAYWLFPAFGWLSFGGLALGFSLSNVLEVSGLLWLLRRRLGGIHGRELWDGTWRMMLATLIMAGGVFAVLALLSAWPVWGQVLLGTAVGGAIYAGSAYLLQVDELQQLLNMARRRLQR
jgi:putative peptidoglycan lipid II flippase